MTKAEFLEYIDHFNNQRFDTVIGYFAPDVTVEYPDGLQDTEPPMTLHGPKAFFDMYKSWAEFTREALELGDFISTEDRLFVELYTEFHLTKDAPNLFGGPKKRGDVVIMTNWVLYNMEGGKFKKIRIAHFRMHDPKTARL